MGRSFLAGNLSAHAFLSAQRHDDRLGHARRLQQRRPRGQWCGPDRGRRPDRCRRAARGPLETDAAGTVTGTIDLGVLGLDYSTALAINEVGAVVGTSDSRAFRWSGGTMEDLNDLIAADSGWRLSQATAINNVGQIAGSGLHNGRFLRLPPHTAPDRESGHQRRRRRGRRGPDRAHRELGSMSTGTLRRRHQRRRHRGRLRPRDVDRRLEQLVPMTVDSPGSSPCVSPSPCGGGLVSCRRERGCVGSGAAPPPRAPAFGSHTPLRSWDERQPRQTRDSERPRRFRSSCLRRLDRRCYPDRSPFRRRLLLNSEHFRRRPALVRGSAVASKST